MSKETQMTPPITHRRSLPRLLTALAGLTLAWLALAAPAHAATPAPGFTLSSLGQPTNLSPALNTRCANDIANENAPNHPPLECDTYTVTATNQGTQPTDGTPVTLSDTLPAGITAQQVSFYWSGAPNNDFGPGLCTTAPVQCTFPAAVQPGQQLFMIVYLAVDPSASGQALNAAAISGGGAPTIQASSANAISTAPVPFGFQDLSTSRPGSTARRTPRRAGSPTSSQPRSTRTSTPSSRLAVIMPSGRRRSRRTSRSICRRG